MRNKIHFSPANGWMNDPNGLIKIDDTYHIFYQHYPHDTVWGPMHWGHATSTDLINFTEHEIAIYPDDELYIFSGSCILDIENVSGLGANDTPALLAFYTSHNCNTGLQEQCLAYSTDYYSFSKYEQNPIIKNPDLTDFRDPKVFKNPIKGGYSMVVAAGRFVYFYHSDNLLQWDKTGEIKFAEYGYSGIVECPDCFMLDNGRYKKWILSASIVVPDDEEITTIGDSIYNVTPHISQYFTGDFNGDVFIFDDDYKTTKLFDYGTDNYAGVTFANSNYPIIMGWGDNWKYINDTTARTHKGKLTCARKLNLIDYDNHFYVSASPITPPIESLSYNEYSVSNIGGNIIPLNLDKSAYIIKVSFTDNTSISFSNNIGNSFVIEVSDGFVFVDRSHSDDKSFSDNYAKENYSFKKAKGLISGKDEITIISDNNYFEIFTNDNIINFSMNTYPSEPFSKLSAINYESIKIGSI